MGIKEIVKALTTQHCDGCGRRKDPLFPRGEYLYCSDCKKFVPRENTR